MSIDDHLLAEAEQVAARTDRSLGDIVGDALRAGHLVRLLPGWEVGSLAVQAIYPSARNLSPKVRGFVDHLAAQFGARPPWDAGLA